jgi:predicted aldo/keto reductase-like oxidoreductase
MGDTRVTRRNALALLTAGAAGLGGGLYGLSREGVLNFLEDDAKSDDPVQVQRKSYAPEPGREVSRFGFGGTRLPILDRQTTKIDYELGQKLVDFGFRHGINYFDTGWMYHDGASEVFFGHALKKYPRDSFMISDKMPSWLVHSLDEAKRMFEEQLRRCQVSYFDNYLVHSITTVDEFNRVFETMGVLDYLKKEQKNGRIKHLGFSFHGNVSVMQHMLEKYEWAFALIMLNRLDWDDENEKNPQGPRAGTLYRMLTAKKMPVFVMEPLRGGAIAQLNTKGSSILKEAAPQRTLASWGMRFVASLPNVQTVLSGMNQFEHLVDNIHSFAADAEPLNAKELATFDRALAEFRKYPTIGCTGCRYCMPCPYGVHIPEIFAWYNSFAGEGRLPTDSGPNACQPLRREFLVTYNNRIPPEARANHCIGCAKCRIGCPQLQLEIPKELDKIEKLVANVQTQYNAKDRI